MKYKYVVIGAGTAGLVVSIGLAKAKKRVLLIEKNLIGGDYTNYGCIPSKTLIASGKVAHLIRHSKSFGIDLNITDINCSNSLNRVRETIDRIRLKENEETLKAAKVDFLKAKAHFTSPKTLLAVDKDGKEYKIEAKKIIIATGSSPVIPKIKGIKDIPFDTNETIFDIKEIPKSLAIIGAGPIGCELGQAFQRLGCQVDLIDINSKILPKESLEVSISLKEILEKENVKFHLNSSIEKTNYSNDHFEIFIRDLNTNYIKQIKTQRLLIASGRSVNLNELKLENASIKYTPKRIIVDDYCRTNQKHIFAIGDIAGPSFYTHKAENMARAALFTLIVPFVKKKISKDFIPRVTFTDPEVASVGLSEEKAIRVYSKKHIRTYFVPFSEIDRALIENDEEGFVQIVTEKWTGKILGSTIVAKRAGEMLSEIFISMHKNINLFSLRNIVHPYPTYNLAFKKAADKYFSQTILRKK